MVKLFFVGTGTPTPTAERFGTCYILQIAEEYIMFDCGPAATYKMVKMGIRPTEVNSFIYYFRALRSWPKNSLTHRYRAKGFTYSAGAHQ
jgi:hypothetical protein